MIGSPGSSRAIRSRAMSAALPCSPQPEKRPRPLAEALHQAGLRQEPEVAGHPRLRLAQNFSEVRDGQFGLRQQRQNAQPRRLRRPP